MGVIAERSGLSPLEWQALAIAAREAAATRDEIEPGRSQEVDLLLRIKGSIDVGASSVSRTVSRPTAVEVLSWVLASGVLSQEQADELLRLMRTSADQSGNLPEVEEGYVAQATMAIAAVSPSRETIRRGAVRGMLRLGLVDQAAITSQVATAVEASTRLISVSE